MPIRIERRAFLAGSVRVLAMNTSVLFVDDEPRIVDGLRRMLRPLRREWEMAFANGGQEALEVMARHPEIWICDQWQTVKDLEDTVYEDWWKRDNLHFTGELNVPLAKVLSEKVQEAMSSPRRRGARNVAP